MGSVEPPHALRERILAAARDEPQEPPRSFRAPAFSALLALALVVTGVLYLVLPRTRAGGGVQEFLARSDTLQRPIRGARGLIAFNAHGEAWLVVHHLRAAPSGKTYEIWIISGSHAFPAGFLQGGAQTTAAHLTAPLRLGSDVVAVSLETGRDAAKPSGPLQFAIPRV